MHFLLWNWCVGEHVEPNTAEETTANPEQMHPAHRPQTKRDGTPKGKQYSKYQQIDSARELQVVASRTIQSPTT